MKSMYEKERAKSLSHFTFGISVDCVVFGFDGSDVKVLVIKRGTEPYKDFQAIPGDLDHEKEDPTDATKRVLNDVLVQWPLKHNQPLDDQEVRIGLMFRSINDAELQSQRLS